MLTPITEPLYVCRDCMDAIEFSDEDLGYTPGTLFAQQSRMMSYRNDLNLSVNRLVAIGEPIDFSASDCQGCGSHMHGTRYGYEVSILDGSDAE